MICPSVHNGVYVVLAIYKNHGVFVEPLRLEPWIDPLRCLNSKMISVGVFEEPSEVKINDGNVLSTQSSHCHWKLPLDHLLRVKRE